MKEAEIKRRARLKRRYKESVERSIAYYNHLNQIQPVTYRQLSEDAIKQITEKHEDCHKLKVKTVKGEITMSMMILIDSISKCNPSEDSIEECLNEILNRNPFKRAGKQCENARLALKIYLNRDNKIDVTSIIEKSTLTKAGKKTVCTLLGIDESQTNKKGRKKTEQPNLFADTDIENDKESVKDGKKLNVMT